METAVQDPCARKTVAHHRRDPKSSRAEWPQGKDVIGWGAGRAGFPTTPQNIQGRRDRRDHRGQDQIHRRDASQTESRRICAKFKRDNGLRT